MILDSVFSKFKKGLSKTRTQMKSGLGKLFTGQIPMSEEILDTLEALLIEADLGMDLAMELIEDVSKHFPISTPVTSKNVLEYLQKKLIQKLEKTNIKEVNVHGTKVVLVVGVNGSGKTTSIGKLATLYANEGKSVLLVAGDTFRAAALEQLTIWSERAGVEIIKNQAATHPASVVYDALVSAKTRNIDVVIIDTAGRLHTQTHLMDELEKVHRVVKKVFTDAPHETILVIDATTGQNGLHQAEEFSKSTPIDHLFLTKLDGTAKGGIALAIHNKLDIPVRYVGLGEKASDMDYFNPTLYIKALLDLD
jgi:fused signal recognition particle receptor